MGTSQVEEWGLTVGEAMLCGCAIFTLYLHPYLRLMLGQRVVEISTHSKRCPPPNLADVHHLQAILKWRLSLHFYEGELLNISALMLHNR